MNIAESRIKISVSLLPKTITGKVLEIGFDQYSFPDLIGAKRYIGLDIQITSSPVDLVPICGNVLAIPFKKHSFELVIITEVIEHIEAEYEDVILQTITNHADCWIVFTGAKPDQGGIGHVNCRPKEYWLEKFAALGFKAVSSSAWEDEWREKKVRWWYVDNLIVLRPTDAYELNIVPQEKGER